MKARHAKKMLSHLLRTHITVVPKDSALLIHLPLEAADYPEQWGRVIGYGEKVDTYQVELLGKSYIIAGEFLSPSKVTRSGS